LGSVEALFFLNSKPRPNPANLARMAQPSLYENACHHFDSLRALTQGRVPTWVSCDGFIPNWSPYIGPCVVNALIRFEGSLHLLYHGGFSSRAPMYEFRLEGSLGALRCRGIHMSNDTMTYEFARTRRFLPGGDSGSRPLFSGGIDNPQCAKNRARRGSLPDACELAGIRR
jgi:hypothetical protein